MQVTSPGILSELIFHRFAGEVIDRGDFVKIYTASNPSYYYGNTLIFPAPPAPEDAGNWIALFETEFAYDAEVKHRTFQWEPTAKADPAAIKSFTDQGFTHDHISVLTATATATDRKPPAGVTFRKIESDADWLAATEMQIVSGFPSIPSADYRIYKEAQFITYRDMADAGLGGWFGAFKGDELVADLGLYFGDDIGRFQSVETAEAHRRQGICSALVHWVSQWAFAKHPGITLMIHADHGDPPEAIYKSLGFVETEQIESVFRPPT